MSIYKEGTTRINLNLDDELYNWLKSRKEVTGASMAFLIHNALENYKFSIDIITKEKKLEEFFENMEKFSKMVVAADKNRRGEDV